MFAYQPLVTFFVPELKSVKSVKFGNPFVHTLLVHTAPPLLWPIPLHCRYLSARPFLLDSLLVSSSSLNDVLSLAFAVLGLTLPQKTHRQNGERCSPDFLHLHLCKRYPVLKLHPQASNLITSSKTAIDSFLSQAKCRLPCPSVVFQYWHKSGGKGPLVVAGVAASWEAQKV